MGVCNDKNMGALGAYATTGQIILVSGNMAKKKKATKQRLDPSC